MLSGVKLVLLRHGDAEPELAGPLGDHGRALTSLGRRQARESAGWLAVEVPEGSRQIWTSPLVRAVQTAEILAHGWSEAQVAVADPLSPGRSLNVQVEWVRGLPGGVDAALCGHEPSLGDLASDLIGRRFPLPFEKGAALVLRRVGDRHYFDAYRAPGHEAVRELP